MAQYIIGTVSITVGLDAVTGTDTEWLTGSDDGLPLVAGDLIKFANDTIFYTISSVASDIALTIEGSYRGTADIVDDEYAVVTDFTSSLGLPLPNQGDIAFDAIIRRAFQDLDNALQLGINFLAVVESMDLVDGDFVSGYTTNTNFVVAPAGEWTSGDWWAEGNNIATYDAENPSTSWSFTEPDIGDLIFNKADGKYYTWTGAEWQVANIASQLGGLTGDFQVGGDLYADRRYPYTAASDLVQQLRNDSYDFSWRNTAGTEVFRVDSDGAFVANELGADADSRVEGDTDANLTYWDASTNRVGIGTATPAQKLTVAGHFRMDAVGGAGTASYSAFFYNGDGNYGQIKYEASEWLSFTNQNATNGFLWFSQGTEIVRLDHSGNLQIDGDLLVDGGNIGITGDTDLMLLTANVLRVTDTVRTDTGAKLSTHSVLAHTTGVLSPGVRTFATNMNTDVAGTQRDIVYCSTDSKFYGCTVTGGAGAATWVAFN